MLLLKFAVFASFLAGSYCMSVECFSLVKIDCREYHFEMEEPPKVVEDLTKICTKIQPLGRCILGVMERCAKIEHMLEDEEDVENFKNTLAFIESSCDEDSEIFKVIADNLYCVVSNWDTMDGICHMRGMNHTEREKLEDLAGEEGIGCVFDAWLFYCINARYDVECGKEVRDAVSQIMDNTDFVVPYCREERRRLTYLEDAILSEFRKGKYGEAALPGIFESIAKKTD